MKHLFLLSFDSYYLCTRRFCTTEFPENITLCTVTFRVQSHTTVHLHVHCTCTVAQVCTCTYSIPFSGCGPDFSFMVQTIAPTIHVHCMYTMFSFIQFPSLFFLFSILHFLSLLLLILLLFSVPFLLSSSFTFPCVPLFSVITQTFMISHLQEQLVDETCLLLYVLMDLYDYLI